MAGSQWDVLGDLDSFPRIPVDPEAATATGILTAIGAAVITLIGARRWRRADIGSVAAAP